MTSPRHTARLALFTYLAALRTEHTFNDAGICTNAGKFEGCYEATVYFANMANEGDTGEGLISFADGSSEVAYSVSREERSAMAGPWDQSGHIFNACAESDLLYVVCEGADGGVVGSHCTPRDWAARLDQMAEEGADD